MKSIPGPKQHWLKGNLGQFDLDKIHTYFYQIAQTFGGICQIRLFHKKFIILQNSETVQHLLKHRPDRFRRARMMETIFTEIGINGVFSAEGKDWQKQRPLMNPAFRPSQIKMFYPQIQQITQRLCSRLALQSEQVDVQSVLMSYTVDITSTLAFGKDVNTLCDDDVHLRENLNVIFPMISYRMRSALPYWRWFKLQRDRDLDAAFAVVKLHVDEFINSAKEKIACANYTSSEQAENLLEAMILARDENGEGFSEQEIFTNVVTLLLAGEDTTANTLAWALDYLVDRPELQDALYREIMEQLGDSYALGSESELGYEQLNDFPLVSGVIHETMRLRPVAPHLYLEPIQDEIIEGYTVPAGTTLIALLNGDGFDETLFPQCHSFDPYRWVNIADSVKKDHANRLMPFGYGPRLCPGRQLSLVEMRLSIIGLVKRFRFERSADSQPADEVIKFTIQPLGLRVNFLPRSEPLLSPHWEYSEQNSAVEA